MLARSLLVTAGIVMGADAFLLLQEPHNPIFSVPSSGLIQWIMLGLLGVIVFMLREYFAKLEKFQAQVDQRLRDLETVTIRHSERLAMFPFFAKLDELVESGLAAHAHRRDSELKPHDHHRKGEEG